MTTVNSPRARKRRIKLTPLRIGLFVGTIGIAIASSGWYLARHWAPARANFPVQGVTVSAESGEVIWQTARAAGTDFAYLLATMGSDHRDASFATNLAAVRSLGIRYGAIHRFSLCRSATAQATRFIATVPRDETMLPPAVEIDPSLDCAERPSRDELLAELNIFLNQIEAHTGKPAILRLSHEIEASYDLSSGLNRTLWLEGAFLPPDYATRPWVMWTASTWRRVPGIEGPVEWDVVKP